MKNWLGYCLAVVMTAFLLSVGSPVLAAAPDDAAVLAVAHKFIDGLNKGDVKSVTALHIAAPTIVDDTPPHLFQGPTAVMDWLSAAQVDEQKRAMTDPSIKLFAKPKHLSVDGDTAYLVVSAVYNFKAAGKPTHVHGILTFALTRVDSAWKIAGWSWANMDK